MLSIASTSRVRSPSERDQRSHHEPGADQQDQGYGHLTDQQAAAQTPADDPPACGLQEAVLLGPARLPGRDHPEEDPGDNRHRQRERESRAVKRDGVASPFLTS